MRQISKKVVTKSVTPKVKLRVTEGTVADKAMDDKSKIKEGSNMDLDQDKKMDAKVALKSRTMKNVSGGRFPSRASGRF